MDTYQEKYTSNFLTDEPEKIRKTTQRLTKALTTALAESNFAELNHLLQETKPMSYSIQGYLEELQLSKHDKDMLMQAGYNSALLDILRLYTASLYAQEEIQKVTTKYRDVILRILEKRGTLLHKDLAAELMTTPNNLTAIIKQMNATSVKLIHVELFSKFKAYSLTPAARQYIEKCMPSMPRHQTPHKKPADYVSRPKNISITPDTRFYAPDILGNILQFSENKYGGRTAELPEKEIPVQSLAHQTSPHKKFTRVPLHIA